MLGAIIGDIVGSIYEFDNISTKDFEFLTDKNTITDDSVLTIATAKAFLESNGDNSKLSDLFVKNYKEETIKYPFSGYGGNFYHWAFSEDSSPYGSMGNGSAMRVSPCGWVANSLEEAGELGELSAGVTHNHPLGMLGAQAVAQCIYLAKTGHSKEEILEHVKPLYPYDYLNTFTIDRIKPYYIFDETCEGSVPQAIEAFLEGNSFEDVIRIAVSLGGDSDTIAAIAGSIAEAYYGIPEDIKEKAFDYLDEDQKKIVLEFREKYVDK